MDLARRVAEAADLGNVALDELLPRGDGPEGRLTEAMRYAALSEGKRLRTFFALETGRMFDLDETSVLRVACALECIHAYSLIHDDLPCMDDDDLRRGRPTTHRRFDVPTATRIGYLLVPVAARVLAGAAAELQLSDETLGRMAEELFQAGGIEGMVGGQWLDLEAERRRLALDDLIAVHRGKTGALIRAACALGAIAAEGSGAAVAALTAYGEDVGLAFQIADDVLDATGTSEELGKTAGRDAELAKSTYVSLLGVKAARTEAERLARRAVGHLDAARVPSGALGTLAEYIVTRSS
jgi:farnesyl diphosphate synthase